MQLTAAQIAVLVNGKVDGNADIAVASFGKIEEAQQGQLAFLANPKYNDFLYTTKASIIIVNNTQEIKQPITATLIKVPDAYSAFATLLDKYQQIQQQLSVDSHVVLVIEFVFWLSQQQAQVHQLIYRPMVQAVR